MCKKTVLESKGCERVKGGLVKKVPNPKRSPKLIVKSQGKIPAGGSRWTERNLEHCEGEKGHNKCPALNTKRITQKEHQAEEPRTTTQSRRRGLSVRFEEVM